MKRALLAATLALSACAGNTPAQNTAVTLYTVQQALLGAQKAALIYLAQPACGAVLAVTCVDPAKKASIKQASQVATTALDKAVAVNAASGSPELVAAAVAVSAMSAVIPTN